MAIAAGIVVGIIILAVLFKPLFGDGDGFVECLRYWLTPDILSLFRGEWSEDWWSEMKLAVWLICGGGLGFAAYTIVSNLLA